MSGHWPYPHPRHSEQHHLRADQHPAQRNRYDGHEQQSMPVVHYNNGLTDVHMWWMVVTQQQQQSQFHPSHQMGYHHGLPAPPYPMLSVPSSRWPLPDPRIYARRPGYGDDARRLATAAPANDPISPSPLRLPPTQAAVVRGPKKEGGTPRGSSPRPTPADRQTVGNGRRPASPRRRIRTPKSCPVARVEPPESSTRPGLLQHPSCWTVGRSSRPPIDESETLTNSMHKRRRVSRTEYLRLPVFSEDERDDAAKAGGQQQHSARKGLSFTDMLIEHRRKSAASSFFTPERSEARRKDNKLQASASRTPAPDQATLRYRGGGRSVGSSHAREAAGGWLAHSRGA
ncbi:hypothetical protein FOZ60_005529 [Perkinsus olseni]|uniref:Uncharacterized protein n=1 Tax=Perkinsus olseni TaxID=32597 RepID=A0A7J6PGG5_PEROL|nr:hypothetical protein FOZ60_005529 [Perkinsus olseni]